MVDVVQIGIRPDQGRSRPAVHGFLGIEDGPCMLQKRVLRQRPLKHSFGCGILFQDWFSVHVAIRGFEAAGLWRYIRCRILGRARRLEGTVKPCYIAIFQPAETVSDALANANDGECLLTSSRSLERWSRGSAWPWPRFATTRSRGALRCYSRSCGP
jgi:hypothetical protein